MESTQYVIRIQSNFAGQYGLGEVVLPGITLFRAGNYDITFDEVQAKYRKATTPVVQQ